MTQASGSTRASMTDWMAYVLSGVPGAVLALAYAAGWVSERTALLLFVPSFIGLNLAHMASAWGRAYLDEDGWRTDPVERIVLPALLVVGALALEAVGLAAALLALQYWLSIHHGGMQNYGILRHTDRSGGRGASPNTLRLERAACTLLPLGALTHRARAVCQTYDGISLPVPPAWLATSLIAGGLVALIAFSLRHVWRALRGEPTSWLGVTLVVSTNLLWSGLIVSIEHPALPLYAIASGHYVQQLYFVWRFEARRDGFEALGMPIRRLVAPPSRAGYLIGMTLCGGAVVALLTGAAVAVRSLATAAELRPVLPLEIPPWVAAMIGVNLSHYWLEHRIWRRRPARGVATQAARARTLPALSALD